MREILRDLPELARFFCLCVFAGAVVYGAAYAFTYVLCMLFGVLEGA